MRTPQEMTTHLGSTAFKKQNAFAVFALSCAISCTLSLSLPSSAEAQQRPVVEVEAYSFEGRSELTKRDVTACKYSVYEGRDGSDNPEAVIYLNSDSASRVNESIRIPANLLPLSEGVLMNAYGLKISYRNGWLVQEQREVSEGPFVNDYKITKIQVSADLMSVKAGSIKAATKGLIREKIEAVMQCKF